MSIATVHTVADVFRLADAEAATLWREGGSIRFRAAGALSPQLSAALEQHRPKILEALAGYPNGRREPGADETTWTARSEQALAQLPPDLADFERGRWLADLSRLWSRGMSGREAAREAFEHLDARCKAHRLDPTGAGETSDTPACQAAEAHASAPGCSAIDAGVGEQAPRTGRSPDAGRSVMRSTHSPAAVHPAEVNPTQLRERTPT